MLPPRYGQSNAQSSLPSRLPPALTDEQLATLDVLTRESIDERLRILEGVSGAVYRCIDDLMRLRSSLPAASPIPTDPANTANAFADETSTASPNHEHIAGSSRGKEKAKATTSNEKVDSHSTVEE